MKRYFLLALFILGLACGPVRAHAAQLPTCTISGGPFYGPDGSFRNIDVHFQLEVHGGVVGGAFIAGSRQDIRPRLDNGMVSFTVPRGATVSLSGNHPSFQTPITFVVPNQATYDLALLANLSAATPPPSGGFTVVSGAQNFRAGTFNITGSGVTVTESPANQANISITGGGGGAWGSITGTLSAQTDLQAALDAKVPTSRTVSTTAPLTGGGALSSNLTLSIPAASGSQNGYLSSADWTTFNGKQPLDAELTALAGLTSAADKAPYFTGTGAASLFDLTGFGRSIVAAANASAARSAMGVALGSDVQAFDATLAALAVFNTNGLLVQTAADTFAGRTITGTANQISVSNGNGVAGNPTLSLPQSIHTAADVSFNALGLASNLTLDHLSFVRGKDSGGNPYKLIGTNASNQVEIGQSGVNISLMGTIYPGEAGAVSFGSLGFPFLDAAFSGTVAAGAFSGSGASLTALPAGQLTGSVDDARLSGNVALENVTNVFSARQTVDLGALGATRTYGLVLRNTTLATALEPSQNAPVLVFEAHGFDDPVDTKWKMTEWLRTSPLNTGKMVFDWEWQQDDGTHEVKQYLTSGGDIGATGYVLAGLGLFAGATQLNPSGLSFSATDAAISNSNTTNPLRFGSSNTTAPAFRFSAANSLTSGNLMEGITPNAGFSGSFLVLGRSSNGSTITTTVFEVEAAGNVLTGGIAAGASASSVVVVGNGTAPTSSPADAVQIYSEGAEAKVRDGAGNITTFSPHNFSLIPGGASEKMAWAFYSERDGVAINIDMLKLARWVEKLTGDKLVYIEPVKHPAMRAAATMIMRAVL